jgi:hypothetical protein
MFKSAFQNFNIAEKATMGNLKLLPDPILHKFYPEMTIRTKECYHFLKDPPSPELKGPFDSLCHLSHKVAKIGHEIVNTRPDVPPYKDPILPIITKIDQTVKTIRKFLNAFSEYLNTGSARRNSSHGMYFPPPAISSALRG